MNDLPQLQRFHTLLLSSKNPGNMQIPPAPQTPPCWRLPADCSNPSVHPLRQPNQGYLAVPPAHIFQGRPDLFQSRAASITPAGRPTDRPASRVCSRPVLYLDPLLDSGSRLSQRRQRMSGFETSPSHRPFISRDLCRSRARSRDERTRHLSTRKDKAHQKLRSYANSSPAASSQIALATLSRPKVQARRYRKI